MKIAVLGTGSAGRTLAARFAELGHDITVGTRDVATTLAVGDSDGNESYGTWAGQHQDVRLATFAGAVADAEIVVNATNGSASRTVLDAAGEDSLGDKVLLDVANPLDFSAGFPPTLLVKDTDSLGEQLQRAFPRLRVVKALNTVTASVMAYPQDLAGGDHTIFVCGNDAVAKNTVNALLAELGHTDVIDLGDISGARGTEMYLPLWVRLMSRLGTAQFSIKLVR
jgi:predicted dinucleotide-binding enzyme